MVKATSGGIPTLNENRLLASLVTKLLRSVCAPEMAFSMQADQG
jgi:hypothetical protein